MGTAEVLGSSGHRGPPRGVRLPIGRAPACLVGLLVIQPVCGAEPVATPLPMSPVTPEIPAYGEASPPNAATPWLDEVRAQRRAWEARRDASRTAYEARRRASNPRAAAQQEAWEDDVRRRRAARMERMDQERELFRSLGPGQPMPPPPPTGGVPALPEVRPGTPDDGAPGESGLYVPPGWDNHWYYRGF